MASLLDAVLFAPTLGGTTDWIVSAAVQGYLTPTASGAVNGKTYYYRAESADLSQWEEGFGVWTSGTSTLTRATVLFNSAGTTSKISFSTVPQVGIVVSSSMLLAFDDAMSLTAAQKNMGRANLDVPGNNVLINSDFRINQRGYVSAATLAAASYAHDRWKAGAGGGDYSFTQLAGSTTITIAASKTLIQVVEDKNTETGNYILSWTGTAQARVGVNTATPAGSYAASPVVLASQTAGNNMSVEFNNGTLGKVKLELGSTPTPFVMGDYAAEFLKCLRYAVQFTAAWTTLTFNAQNTYQAFMFPVPMRAAPNMSNASFAVTGGSAGTPAVQNATIFSTNIYNVANNWTSGIAVTFTGLFSAEL